MAVGHSFLVSPCLRRLALAAAMLTLVFAATGAVAAAAQGSGIWLSRA